jgi:hypothetical protein
MATSNIPLNKFRLLSQNLVSGSNLIYSSSIDVSTIVLSTQITNIVDTNKSVTVLVQRSGSNSQIALIKNAIIPPNESLNPLSGKLVLERYDQFIMTTNSGSTLDVVLSVLENANN